MYKNDRGKNVYTTNIIWSTSANQNTIWKKFLKIYYLYYFLQRIIQYLNVNVTVTVDYSTHIILYFGALK